MKSATPGQSLSRGSGPATLPSMTRQPTRTPLPFALALTALAGCVAVDNDRHTIGRGVPIETVSPPPSPDSRALPADGPSIAGTDRSNWQRTEYLVPVDGTYHAPSYTFGHATPTETVRQRGIDPSPVEALELSHTNGQQDAEALAAPVIAAAEVLAMIPRMFIEYPWVSVRSPQDWPYQRSRANYDPPDAPASEEP